MAECFDCGIPYPFGTDLILPDQQWKLIFPEFDGSGLLCPNCIANRVAKNPSSTVILAWVDCLDSGPFKTNNKIDLRITERIKKLGHREF